MKRSILILAAIFFLSLSAAYAQQDTQDTTAAPTNAYTKDMIKITARDLPAPVQEALKDPMYSGWEAGDIHRSEASDRFAITISDGTREKIYYFDQNGKPLKL